MLSVKKFKASDLTLFFFWKKEIEEFFAFFFSLQQKKKETEFSIEFWQFLRNLNRKQNFIHCCRRRLLTQVSQTFFFLSEMKLEKEKKVVSSFKRDQLKK